MIEPEGLSFFFVWAPLWDCSYFVCTSYLIQPTWIQQPDICNVHICDVVSPLLHAIFNGRFPSSGAPLSLNPVICSDLKMSFRMSQHHAYF
jgi:hypothetical protein